MKDYWRSKDRSSWLLRTSGPWSLWSALKDEFRNVFGRRGNWDSGWFITLKTTPNFNGYCYCYTGSVTDLRFRLLGFRLWLHRGRWAGPIPCGCDIGFHEYHVSQGEDCQCIVAEMEDS